TLPPNTAADFRERLRSADPDRREVAEVLTKAGSLAYARRVTEDHSATARAALDGLPRSECRVILEQLTDWTVRREK
ncbi:MAG: hypothetical protein ABGY75_07765, partial [Gemmataceae bacterium]